MHSEIWVEGFNFLPNGKWMNSLNEVFNTNKNDEPHGFNLENKVNSSYNLMSCW